MALRQGLVHGDHDVFIGQHLIGRRDPVVAKIAHFLGDQSIAEAELGAAHLNHASSPRAWRRRQPAATAPN
jgi:hypothetical protein